MFPFQKGENATPVSGRCGDTRVSIARSDSSRDGRLVGKFRFFPTSGNSAATLNLKINKAYASAILPTPKQGTRVGIWSHFFSDCPATRGGGGDFAFGYSEHVRINPTGAGAGADVDVDVDEGSFIEMGQP